MKEAFFRVIALIRKELLVILKDPRSRIMMFVPPIMQCLIFGYAATYDLNNVPYALVDMDRSSASQAFIAGLEGSGIFTRVATVDRPDLAAPYLLTGRAVLIVAIDKDFEKALAAGGVGTVQVISDGRNSNTAGIAQGYVGAIAYTFGQEWLSSHGRSGLAVQVRSRVWFNPNLETCWSMIPSLIGTITMMMTMMLTAMAVAREREEGTFDQLLVAPFRPTEILIGKAIPSMMIGLLQSTLIFMVALFWFRIPFAGSYLVLYTGLFLFLAAAIGMGLFLSSIAKNMQQAMILSFVCLMPFMLLSGLMAPTDNMPKLLQYFTLINPLAYAIDIVRQVYLQGATLYQLARELLALAAIAVVTLPIASWFFRNRLV